MIVCRHDLTLKRSLKYVCTTYSLPRLNYINEQQKLHTNLFTFSILYLLQLTQLKNSDNYTFWRV